MADIRVHRRGIPFGPGDEERARDKARRGVFRAPVASICCLLCGQTSLTSRHVRGLAAHTACHPCPPTIELTKVARPDNSPGQAMRSPTAEGWKKMMSPPLHPLRQSRRSIGNHTSRTVQTRNIRQRIQPHHHCLAPRRRAQAARAQRNGARSIMVRPHVPSPTTQHMPSIRLCTDT